jgi:hypothetical protein
MIIATFRANFPEFVDVTKYPDSMITFWSGIAEAQIVSDRWGDIISQAIELHTAHHVYLAYDGKRGKQTAIQSAKSVGNVSVSHDTTSSIELNAGHWNLTNYGKMFVRLSRMYGAGCIQL